MTLWLIWFYIFTGMLFGAYKDNFGKISREGIAYAIFWPIVLGRFLGSCFILVLKQGGK